MTLHPYLRDSEGRPVKRYTSVGTRKTEAITPMDMKRKLTREVCVFRLGESDRRFWISGQLAQKDGEFEEDGGDRKKDRGERERHEDPKRREKERARSRSRRRPGRGRTGPRRRRGERIGR